MLSVAFFEEQQDLFACMRAHAEYWADAYACHSTPDSPDAQTWSQKKQSLFVGCG
jgi:hypothetical protein